MTTKLLAIFIGLMFLSTLTFAREGNVAESKKQDSANECKALEKEFQKVWRAWRSEVSAARRNKASKEDLAALEAKEPTAKYIPKFEAGAKKHAGTDLAIPYLQWIFSWATGVDKKIAKSALDQLVRDHLLNPVMGRIAFSLALKGSRGQFDRNEALAIQGKIAESAPTEKLRSDVLFWRSYLIARTKSTAGEKTSAMKDLVAVIEKGDEGAKKQATGLLFEMQRLQIGMVVPDIKGSDLDGVEFKLSDYQGKVVMLDFWGDW